MQKTQQTSKKEFDSNDDEIQENQMVEVHDSTSHSTQDEQGTVNEQKVSNIEEEYKARYGARNGRY